MWLCVIGMMLVSKDGLGVRLMGATVALSIGAVAYNHTLNVSRHASTVELDDVLFDQSAQIVMQSSIGIDLLFLGSTVSFIGTVLYLEKSAR